MNVIYPSCNGRETTTFELVHLPYYPPSPPPVFPTLSSIPSTRFFSLFFSLSLSFSLRLNERQAAHRGKISRGWAAVGVVKAEKLR